jgi:hypothetical protein
MEIHELATKIEELNKTSAERHSETSNLLREVVSAIGKLTGVLTHNFEMLRVEGSGWSKETKPKNGGDWRTLVLFTTLLGAVAMMGQWGIDGNKDAMTYMRENDSASVRVLVASQLALVETVNQLDEKLQMEIAVVEGYTEKAERRSGERHAEQSTEIALRLEPLNVRIKQLEVLALGLLKPLDKKTD